MTSVAAACSLVCAAGCPLACSNEKCTKPLAKPLVSGCRHLAVGYAHETHGVDEVDVRSATLRRIN